MLKLLRSQEGSMAILGVMMISLAITTLLSSFYIYTVNQAKYHARIKEAYQMINVTERVAAAARKAYDQGMAANDNGENCDGGAAPVEVPAGSGIWICGGAAQEICVEREDAQETYCTTIFASNAYDSVPGLQETYYVRKTDKRPAWAKAWLGKLHAFYDDSNPNLKTMEMLAQAQTRALNKPSLLQVFTKSDRAWAADDMSDVTYVPNRVLGAEGFEYLSADYPPAEEDKKAVFCKRNPMVSGCRPADDGMAEPVPVPPSYVGCNESQTLAFRWNQGEDNFLPSEVNNTDMCSTCADNAEGVCTGMTTDSMTDGTDLANDALTAVSPAQQNFFIVR